MARFTTANSFHPVKCCPTCNRRLPATRKSPEERFWEKVDKRGPDECWQWNASLDSLGYGHLQFYGRVESAHRASYRINKGIIAKGLSVCHECDNPACVNPKHLFLGTHAVNMSDMAAKGRANNLPKPGSLHWNAKLKEPDVIAIRASTKTPKELAESYGVSTSLITMIRRRTIWRHI